MCQLGRPRGDYPWAHAIPQGLDPPGSVISQPDPSKMPVGGALTYIMHMPALYFQKTDPESCDACLGSGEKECDWCHGTGEERTNEGAECNNAMLICAEIPFWSSYK